MGAGQSQIPKNPDGTQDSTSKNVVTAISNNNEANSTSTDSKPTTIINAIGEKSNSDGESSGCPMKRTDGSYSYDWGAIFRPNFPHRPDGSKPLVSSTPANPTKQPDTKISTGGSTSNNESRCPVKSKNNNSNQVEYNVYSQPLNPDNNMPYNPNQLPAAIQNVELSTERVPSSIPKGGAADDNTTWTYPSPQMFYNALARKGKLQDTVEDDIESVVALHNNMNEKTWKKVLEWESVIRNSESKTKNNNNNKASKLLKFQGRPTDLSPKAAFKHYVLGHPLPYDRHDWTVQRDDGTIQRYVIDYYYDDTRAREAPDTALPRKDDYDATPSLLVDVRPAIDSPETIFYRAVLMPYARQMAKTTTFEPLPLQPTSAMKSNVKESIEVWQSIQQQVFNNKKHQQENEEKVIPINTDAQQLAKLFAQVTKDCKKAQKKVDQCTDDSDCARASIDLTMCIGKIVCPLQHSTLQSALKQQSSNDDESVIDIALTRLNDCVSYKTMEHHNNTNSKQVGTTKS